ncbi:MAG: Uma2 family endonuclease [Caulobacterales bacterium]|nr:Uma2 family endonuclease [Caulobacterales bacterium]
MMTGASHAHDRIVVNVIAFLHQRLRGGRRRPTTDDIALRARDMTVRRPGVTVECTPVEHTVYESRAPSAVFEVLSPSTRAFDQVQKREEYKRVPSLRHIILIDAERPRVVAWSRSVDSDAWADTILEGLGETLRMEAISVDMPLAAVFEDVRFPDR